MLWHDKYDPPKSINYSGISSDIMIEYCDQSGNIVTQIGRCYTTYNNDEKHISYYVYENYTQTNFWILLDISKVKRWYSLGGVTTINYSNTTLYGFDCKLSFPNLTSTWFNVDVLYIKWKDTDGKLKKSLGFYHEEEGFCIYKDYRHKKYLSVNDTAVEWTPIEF